MKTILVLSKLTKVYGRSKVPAISELTLSTGEGEVYGFLGSNGAGKSTTIRTIMGFLRASGGSVTLLGKDSSVHGVELRRDVGYLAGDVVLPKGVTGRKLLHYLGNLHGAIDEEYVSQLEKRFEAQLDKKVETLSKGNRQKIGIIQAFMHKPKILVLDEPTSGLDPLMQEQFYKLVQEAKGHGATVFLSSHSFNEVERICDRIGIIREGKLVHEGPVAKVMAERVPSWRIIFKRSGDVTTITGSSHLTIIEKEDPKTVVVRPSGSISAALAVLAKVDILSMSSGQQELEDEFMSFYAHDAKEGTK